MSDKTKVQQTLLLADDSITIQRVIELTFADEAITVVAVSDGDQAIQRIEADPPDIVLADIAMPGLTGYQVAQHIKASPRLKHIPVLLLTGAFDPVDHAKAAAAGCDGVLAKPFEPQLVIARVKELLGPSGQDAAPAAENPALTLPPEPPGPPAESWAPPRAEPANDKPRPAQVARLDDYFEQLDAAFQTLGSVPVGQSKGAAAASPVTDIADWFGVMPAALESLPDLGLSSPEPVYRPEPERPIPESASPEPVAPLLEPSSPPATLPPIADALAAIFSAEPHEPMPALAAPRPTLPIPPASSHGGGSLSEEAIDEITRRVLVRLSDQVVRNTVVDVVSSIAERLVREEIDRIKASIR